MSPQAAQQANDFWDSLPDGNVAAESQQPQTSASNMADNGSEFWDAMPDAPPMPKAPPSVSEDVGKSAVSGVAQGFLDFPNLPTHMAQFGAQSISRPLGKAYEFVADKTGLPPLSQGAAEYLTYPIENPNKPSANELITKTLLPAAIHAETGANVNYEPKTKAGEYTQSTTRMAPFMLDPEAGITRAALGGFGSQAGQDIAGAISDTPESRELGGTLGMMAGGSAPDAIKSVSAPYYKAAKEAVNKAGFGEKSLSLSPDIQATPAQVAQAARNVQSAANSPEALARSLASNPNEIVPGSKPTMAEISPDQGIAQYQDAARTNNPVPFQERAAAQQTARAQALNKTRGEGNPQSLGEYFANQLQQEDAQGQRAEDVARINASGKGVALGRYGEMPSEGVTADTIQNAQGTRKETASEAWKVLDPYKNSSADLATLRHAAVDIHNEASQYGAQPLDPAITTITENILSQPNPKTDNLGALQRFRSSVSDAQRLVKAGSQSMRYLQILKNAVDKGIENTVNGIIQNEDKAVAAGQMAKEDTLGTGLISKVQSWYENRNAGANTAVGNLANANAGSGYKSFSRTFGAGSEKGGQPSVSPGSEGVSPAFGETQKQQYESARSLTFRHETLSRLENSGAVNPDGTLDADKYDRWYQKNKGIFKSNQDFGKQLTDWRTAQEQLNQIRAERAEQQRINQTSRAAALIKNDPVNEVGKIFSSKTKDPVKEFSSLVDKVKGDKDATEGLKAAVGEHILKNVAKVDLEEVEGKDVGKINRPAALRNFIRQHRSSLKVIYGNELQDLENVAADIKRTQAFYDRAKIAGQSNTAKDIGQAAKQKGTSVFGHIVRNVLPPALAGIGAHFGSAGAVIGATLGKMSDSFTSKGLTTIKAIEQEMMLHPSTFGKAMLEQIPGEEIPLPLQRRIASTLIKSVPQAGTIQVKQNKENKSED